jgi:predicted membrane chloride channel (bestrophin family)
MTVEYAGDDFNELTAFFRWRGTVFSTVLCSPAIWVLMLLHCTFLYMHTRLDLDLGMIVKGAAPDEISTVSINLLIIFLVYYGGNCYSRYFEMYEQCMAMAGDVACWVGLCRVYFPQANADILWNLSRHMVASVYFLYFELGGLASDGGRVITEAEWSVLFRSSLISESERKVLEKYRGSRFFLMQSWALRLASEQCTKPDTAAGADIMALEEFVLKLRKDGGAISNLLKQPEPFPRYHLLMLMLNLNLVVLAYAMIEANTFMSIPCYFIVCFVCLGLKQTSISLSNPFGMDAVDFETDVFMARIMINTKELISRQANYVPKLMPLPDDVPLTENDPVGNGRRYASDGLGA